MKSSCHIAYNNNTHFKFQISDFGMSRDVEDENYYVSKGGKVPVKWTAPEVVPCQCSVNRSGTLNFQFFSSTITL